MSSQRRRAGGRSQSSNIESLESRVLLSGATAHHTEHQRHALHVRHVAHVAVARAVSAATMVQRAAAAAATAPASRVASRPTTTKTSTATTPAALSASSPPPGTPDNLTFHGDQARTGFNQNETVLNQSNVSSGFGQLWQSPKLDGAIYATPLYADSITIAGNGNVANHAGDGVQSAAFQNKTLGVVFTATGGGSVYAVAAQDTAGASGIAPGTILWKTHLGNAYAGVDGNSIGVLSTPIIDLAAGRMYVTASVTDYLSPSSDPLHGGNNFEVFALSLKDGSLITGWPVIFSQAKLDAVNQNNLVGNHLGVLFSSSGADQRGALNLSADGSTLYVDWACYGASNGGWLTTVATGVTRGAANGQTPAILSAFSAVDNTSAVANGGMWGAGGPVIDAAGNVFVSTGDSPTGTGNPLGDFGNSVLEFAPGQTLTLTGIYSPWNYQTQDTIDSDLGGGSPIVVQLPAGSSTTTDLLAVGGKQGNGYLLNAGNNLNNPTARPGSPASYPADLTRRPPGTVTASQDPSLYDTSSAGIRSYFTPAQTGPLALFGPYNESSASGNTAKARDTPASFTGPDGSQYVIWAGASKTSVGASTPVAPSLYLTKVVHTAGQPAYLQVVTQNTAVMSNPGSNLITGNGTSNEIDWVVDAGVQRTDGLTSFSNGAPTLYAYDALTMQPLWNSSYQELDLGGKYNSIAVARGNVFLGTDRIQAFGLTGNAIVDDSVTGAGANQFNYSGSGWQHVTGSTTMGTFQGTVSTDNVQGDFATLTFTGSTIKVYANEKSGYGSATFSVDGATTQSVLLSPANSSPNGLGAGDVLVYTVTGLGAGPHTLKVLNNAASNTIAIDKVEIVPPITSNSKLGVSMTEGNVLAQTAGPIYYTINYNNAGSIVNATGVGATGVVLTETVPTNTTADLGNSTAGWALVTAGPGGAGSAGSVYRYTVGSLAAGVTGSAVFSVDLNASIPPGTTTVTNTVTISDTVGDSSSGSRTTPIPPAAEAKLIFSQQPPANGGAGIPLSPAITVTAQDQFGNTYTPDSGSTVTLTLNGGTFAGGGTTATAVVSNGVATFNNLIIGASGTYTLTASDGALTPTNSAPFTIAATAKLGFTNAGTGVTQQPTQTFAGSPITPTVKVGVEDQSGAVIATDTSTVILTINHGSFANGSTSVAVQAVNGVATFNNLAINAVGSYTLVATDGNLVQAQSNSFNVVAQATKLVFAQQPNNTYTNEAVNPSVAVALQDAFGNVDTTNVTPVAVTLNGGATFFGGGTTATVTPVNGVASFNDLVVTSPGSYTLTATAAGLTSVTSYPFAITAHALTSIDDNNANNTGGTPQVVYSTPTARWVGGSTTLAHNFDGTLTTDSTGGDTASVTFNGTLVTLYAAKTPGGGAADVFIDGNNPIHVDLTSATSVIAPVFTSSLLSAGSHTIIVKVTSGTVSIDRFVVGPATPTLAWATPADLTYGTALDGTELDAFVTDVAGFPGTFTYSPAAGTVLGVGQNQLLHVTFTPTDGANYDAASATVPINVTKATPTISWTGPGSNLSFGQALTAATLNATATINGVTVPGTFVYTPGLGTVPPVGDDFDLSLTFTPDDTTDYNVVTAESDVDVDPATPVVTWNNPADIVDGTPLGAAQLNATASVPGTFTYTPAAGTILGVGQHQALGVVFRPDDSDDYNIVATSAFVNVVYGSASKLAFAQQPTNIKGGGTISPAVQVAVEDSAGTILPGNTSTVTITLNGGTFIGGGNTVTAQAVNGVATFGNLAISANGTYTLTATDGALTTVTSNPFNVGSSIYVSFNKGSTDFTSNFALNDQGATVGTPRLTFGSSAGVDDLEGPSAGGGVSLNTGAAIDETANYTPTTVDLSDGATHVMSEYVTAASGIGSGDRLLQLGFVTSPVAGFNAGYSFISARLYGDYSAEFQYNNATSSAVSTNKTAHTGTINVGDWLQMVFTTRETAAGAFQGTFSVLDYGPLGIAAVPTTVLAPVAYSVSGLNTIGTATTMVPGFRTATTGSFTSPIAFDNFAVDQAAAKLGILAQPTSAPAGGTLGTFVAAVQDLAGNTVAGDSSTITLSLSHGTFANGQTTVSATAVNGIASFPNLVINAPGGYILRATDTNPNLDPGFAPFTINGPTQLGYGTAPANATAGVAMKPIVVNVDDTTGATVVADSSTVTLTLNGGTFSGGGNTATATAVNGVATFSNLIVASAGTYTLTASDASLTTTTSAPFTVAGAAAKLAFVQQPTNANPATALSPAVTVSVVDSAGRLVTSNGSTVTLTLSSGTFTGGGTTATATAVNGVATFSGLSITSSGAYTLAATDGSLSGATSAAFAVLSPVTTSIDDTVVGTGKNQIQFSGTAWTEAALTGAFNTTNTTSSTTNATATMQFTGTQVKLYAVKAAGDGYATVTIDGASATTFDEYNASTAGNQLVYTSAVLTPGTHTIVIKVAGQVGTTGGGTTVSVDRLDVIKASATVAWTNPASIAYGTALSGTQLNATATYNGSAVPGTFVYSPAAGTVLNPGAGQTLSVVFVPTDTADYATTSATASITVNAPTVVGRQLFYNDSKWDGGRTAADSGDDAAIATDKSALLPGHTATFANYSSYSKGINGIIVDISRLPSGLTPTAADFTFKVGNTSATTSWTTPNVSPTITVRPGAGVGGSDRVEITFPDYDPATGLGIAKQWLQVTVNATANTGLAAADVFYFGNALGDSGNSATDATVDAIDEIGARNNQTGIGNPATVTNLYDYNRDGIVNATDQILARNNQTGIATTLKLISE